VLAHNICCLIQSIDELRNRTDIMGKSRLTQNL
jgi:hypothetical protein